MSDTYFTDFKMNNRDFGDVVSSRDQADIAISKGDLLAVSGRENLTQALIHRLMTRKGDLKELGHPEYGSRLHELQGQPNNERTQSLARLYIHEALGREKRVEEIERVEVTASTANTMTIRIRIMPKGGESLTLNMSQTLA
ncbi:MAG: GPW/gp25 family protein [Leptospirales bacterium]